MLPRTGYMQTRARWQSMFSGASILLLVALLIVLGSAGGKLAQRMHLPALTGQIVVGILLGESALHLVPHQDQGLRDVQGPPCRGSANY